MASRYCSYLSTCVAGTVIQIAVPATQVLEQLLTSHIMSSSNESLCYRIRFNFCGVKLLRFASSHIFSRFYFHGCKISSRRNKALCKFSQGETFADVC